MADAADGGSDWEVVSLTASAYAAAPGPTWPLLLDAHNTETGSASPSPPPASAAAAIFMSQHFNLPPGEPLTTEFLNRGRQEFTPAVAGGGEDCSESDSTSTGLSSTLGLESEDVLVADTNANSLQRQIVGGGELISLLPQEEPQQTTMLCSQSQPDATAGSAADAKDGIAVDSAAVPAHAATVAVPSGGVPYSAAQAWWKKTFSFQRNNGTEPLAFRFVFVAGKLQLQHLGPDEFSVHSQKINLAVTEPLGQVKVGMLGGTGHPVAQQG